MRFATRPPRAPIGPSPSALGLNGCWVARRRLGRSSCGSVELEQNAYKGLQQNSQCFYIYIFLWLSHTDGSLPLGR